MRVGPQNVTEDSFFDGELWQILRRFLFCFLFALSLLPLWMTTFNLEIKWLQQGLVLAATYALIYILKRYSKALSRFVGVILILGIIGALVPGLPVLSYIGEPIYSVFQLIYNRISYGLGVERILLEASFVASAGFVAILGLLVALIILWRPLPLLGFVFSSMLFGFAEEISENASGYGLELAYAVSILIILIIWSTGESRHSLSFRKDKRKKPVHNNSNERSRRKRALPVSIIVLAVLILLNSLIPVDALYVKSLDDYMSRLLGQRYQEPSAIPFLQFSLRDLGYYPLENRLGGTPDLSDEPYMYVDTDSRPIHLRGTAYFEYTGLAWTQDLMNPNWLMAHSRNVEAQKQILGQLHAFDEGSIQSLLPDRSFELRPAREQQVIFHGGRPSDFVSLDGGSFNVYFNQSGNLYLDRRITEDGYRGIGQWFSVRDMHDVENLENLIDLFPTLQMSADERSRWLALPQLPTLRTVLQERHPELEELVYGAASSDAERASAIRTYLAENFTYSLNVETPPDDRDFVTYFLESGVGYCTYFGTALTVLLRTAGIPARYVEGFLLPQSQTSSTRELTGRNGHAWTEVWFDGLGWVPLDATPSATLDQMENRQTVDPEQPQPTEPAPTETVTETERVPGPEETESEDLPSREDADFPLLGILLFILKLLLYILLFSSPIWLYVLWRYWVYKRRHDSEYLQKMLDEGSVEALVCKIDLDLQAMWKLEGNSRNQGETIREFAQRVSRESNTEIDQIYLDLTEKIYYDDPDEFMITEEDLKAFFTFYENEERRLKVNLPRKDWLLKRFLWSDYHPLPR